ncbi:FAD-dependent oxidoreductase [Streptomyces sp. OF3]|uniref:FAD-dependent oxidoreductase n=1 Tax=Streptomyces alkaliterrae TaxID=2213162 RepID=A0A7W3WJ52_9ACTN|nr:FAD-dependent oxidoreductase [Streptomyces alkaliterrae]MBB1253311.1 FAD-dependent oxidoreductase [Streptomyces alkaliterrae]
MNGRRRVLVVGGGVAAHRLAEKLHDHGHRGGVTLLEPATPPPASEPAGTVPALVVPGALPTGLDLRRREVWSLRDGVRVRHPYDVLVLATGARPLVPDVPGLRMADGRLSAGVLAPRPSPGPAEGEPPRGPVAVVGDGPAALTYASDLARRGVDVTLLCRGRYPLARRLDEHCGALLAERLALSGVTVLTGRALRRRVPDGLLLDDGRELPAASVLLCLGATPDTGLARAAGLPVGAGVLVDHRFRTSDPHVYAVGPCAEPVDGELPRRYADFDQDVELDQAEALAEILATGRTPAGSRPELGVPGDPLRLPSRVAELFCVGRPDDFTRPGVRVVTLSGAGDDGHARLAVRGDRLVAAVVFGLPKAVAALAHLHRHGRRLPSDRLSLLLGLPSGPPSSAHGAADDLVLCLCNNVSRRALSGAWRAGARTVPALAAATGATTGCGGCTRELTQLCRSLGEAPPAPPPASRTPERPAESRRPLEAA